jgi:hypothetical protein
VRILGLLGRLCVRIFIAACVFLVCFFALMFVTTLDAAEAANKDDDARGLTFAIAGGTCLVASLLGALVWWRGTSWFDAAKHSLLCAIFAAAIGIEVGKVLPLLIDLRQTEGNRTTFLTTLGVASLVGGALVTTVLTLVRMWLHADSTPKVPNAARAVPSAVSPTATAG